MAEPRTNTEQRFKWLPPMNTWKFHLLLGFVAIAILGPLGGITAAYMNFSIGFFVGGQVLAGILGSAITFGYGSEGKHGANYMQTLAASVAGMAGMAVLVQAMNWLGFDVPPWWELVLYYLCIGMFGVGVGMLFTPLLVDQMRLTYPSGLAVANILRALTDRTLLRQSIAKLASGTGIGFAGGIGTELSPTLQEAGVGMSTIGAGMIVGARIAFPAIVVGLIGEAMMPGLVESGWLEDGEPFRKIGFVIALGAILGAAVVDITLVMVNFVKRLRTKQAEAAPQEDWKRVNVARLVAWVVFWAVMVFLVATQLFHQAPLYVLLALGLVFVFMIVNGISLGISDSNPISSAFVLTVLLIAVVGLLDAPSALVCASIVLISVSVGGDMQQDRSTGWRLGTNRVLQFRYQVVGITMGALLSVGMAALFMGANPTLYVDQTETKKVNAYASERGVVVLGETAGITAVVTNRLAGAPKLPAAEAEDRIKKTAAEVADLVHDNKLTGAEKSLFESARDLTINTVQTALQKGEALPGPLQKAYDAAKAVAKGEVKRWQAAMTFKFVGAIDIFIGKVEFTAIEKQLLKEALDNPAQALVPVPELIAEGGATAIEKKAYATALLNKARETGRVDKLAGYDLTQLEQTRLDLALANPEGAPVPVPEWLVPKEKPNPQEEAAYELAKHDRAPELKDYAVKLATAFRTHKKAVQIEALCIGIAIGAITEILRKLLKRSTGYKKFRDSGKAGFAVDFALDAIFLPSPYASSFGGFVELTTSLWFGIGGIFSSYSDTVRKEALRSAAAAQPEGEALPEDMSTNSLVGGGLIAGDALAALAIGVKKLVS